MSARPVRLPELLRLFWRFVTRPELLVAFAIYLAGIFIFANWMLWSHREEELDRLDTRLLRAASRVALILPWDLPDRLLGGETVAESEMSLLRQKLQAMMSTSAEVSHLGICTLSQEGDNRYLLGTALPDDPDYLRLHRAIPRQTKKEPSGSIYHTLRGDNGTYRLVQLPQVTPRGETYAAFAIADLKVIDPNMARYFPLAFAQGGVFLLLALPVVIAFARFWSKQQQEVDSARQLADLAKVREERLQLEFLRFQLNPHFLFNALNSICSLIVVAPARAEEMTLRLSRFCRSIIFARHRDLMTLEEKMQVARDYLAIEQVRWGERLQVRFDVQVPDPGEIEVPSLLLLPLLENAVKYGQRSGGEVLTIEVSARTQEGLLLLEVANSGRWFDPHEMAAEHDTRFGLDNLRRRLDLFYGPGDYLSHRVDEEQGLVRFSLTVPLQRRSP